MKPGGAPARVAPVIAIDGPSGAGKGSVSRAVAGTGRIQPAVRIDPGWSVSRAVAGTGAGR